MKPSSLPFCLLLFFIACNDSSYEKPATKISGKNDSTVFKPSPSNPYASVDVSPLDISYFPVDYPIQKMSGQTTEPPVARVIYGRPQKQGRKIFGNLIKYGEPWRLGANEATEIEFFQSVIIQDKQISKGRYILYAVPGQNSWKIILNSNIYSWGLKPNPEKDESQFEVHVQQTNNNIEFFTMVFEKLPQNGTNLLVAWENIELRLPIKF